MSAFAFESVVVEIMGDVLQFEIPVEIESGVVMESIVLAVVYNNGVMEVVSVEVDDGIVNDWLIGSKPIRILLAFILSFSQAIANICSACIEVRCAGVGRDGKFSHPSLVFLLRRQDFKYVRSLLRARSEKSGNWREQESMMACTFSLGCFEIGIILSRFSSTNRRTNF